MDSGRFQLRFPFWLKTLLTPLVLTMLNIAPCSPVKPNDAVEI